MVTGTARGKRKSACRNVIEETKGMKYGFSSGFSDSFARSQRRFKLIFAAAAAVIVAGIGVEIAYQTQSAETVRVTVTDKERHMDRDGAGKYMVFTDKEVFENTDNALRGKFNSSDIQGRLQKGCTYDVKVQGWRNQYASTYRNILEAEHVPTPGCPAAPNPR
jgi:hypothetical protein